MTLAIACSGGGNWTLAQLGFIQALHERGYETRAASGVSFGSFGAYAAVTGDVLGVMARIRRFFEVVDTNLMKVWEHRSLPGALVKRVEEGLRTVLPARAETDGDYFIMAVKVPTLQPVTFSKHDSLPDVVRAAMAMPPLPAATYQGQTLRDAGLRLKYGVTPLVKAGYQKVLCLGAFQDFFSMRWQAMKRMFSAFRPVHAHEVVMSMAHRIGLAEWSRTGFAAMEAVFEEGYKVGRRTSTALLDSLVNDRVVPVREGTWSAVAGL